MNTLIHDIQKCKSFFKEDFRYKIKTLLYHYLLIYIKNISSWLSTYHRLFSKSYWSNWWCIVGDFFFTVLCFAIYWAFRNVKHFFLTICKYCKKKKLKNSISRNCYNANNIVHKEHCYLLENIKFNDSKNKMFQVYITLL